MSVDQMSDQAALRTGTGSGTSKSGSARHQAVRGVPLPHEHAIRVRIESALLITLEPGFSSTADMVTFQKIFQDITVDRCSLHTMKCVRHLLNLTIVTVSIILNCM
jgi:hypothetical protein